VALSHHTDFYAATMRTYVGLAISALLLIILTMNVAVPVINQAALTQKTVAASTLITAPFTYGVPIQLGHSNVVQGSVKLYNSTYTAILGTDYVVDYTNGTVTVLATGNLVNTSNYDVDYHYLAPVYTGTNLSLLHMTVLMLVLGIIVVIAATMLIRWL